MYTVLDGIDLCSILDGIVVYTILDGIGVYTILDGIVVYTNLDRILCLVLGWDCYVDSCRWDCCAQFDNLIECKLSCIVIIY